MKKAFYLFTVLILTTGISQARLACHSGFTFQVNGLTVSFTDASTSSNTITSWQWDFGDGATSALQNPSHIFTSSDTFHVCLTIHDDHGCTSTWCHDVVTAGPHPCTAGFTFQVNGFDVNFTDASVAGGAITSWQWDFGDGSTSTLQNPQHTYATDDTFHVCLTIHDSHGCSNTFCHNVIVTAPHNCSAGFTFHANGFDVNFTDASVGIGAITSWQWDFGDGSTSTLQNPHHTYATDDTFHVCLTIHDSHGCSDTYCHDVIVTGIHSCHALFTYTLDSTGTVVHFTNASTGSTGTTTYLWDFGDGATSTLENPTYAYPHHGHHVVCLYISDAVTGCSAHYCHVVFHGHARFQHPGHSAARFKDEAETAYELTLSVFPNPVRNAATLGFTLYKSEKITVEVYDLPGNKVYSQDFAEHNAGSHTVQLNSLKLADGVYILKLHAGEKFLTRKITVLN